jgi:hypothetical protein
VFAAAIMVAFFLFFWDRIRSEGDVDLEEATRLPEEAPR